MSMGRGAFGLLMVLVVACSGGGSSPAGPPDGYQQIDHPDASLAVPASWVARPSDLEIVDPEAIHYGPSDAAVDALGAAVIRAEGAPTDPENLALLDMTALTQTATGKEQTRREFVDIAGAEESFVLQVEAESRVLEEVVRMTFVTAMIEEGHIVEVRVIATENQFDDGDLQVLLDTMEVGG